jgi:hypothetical protein
MTATENRMKRVKGRIKKTTLKAVKKILER